MQITIVSGQVERLVRLAKTVFFSVLCLSMFSCAVKPTPDTWDPVKKDEEKTSAGFKRSTASMAPAMSALVMQADSAIEQQQWSEAVAILERALRINPKQAEAWTRMAVVYLGQDNPEQCLHMAKKSNRHAKSNHKLQAYNWLLMSRAYKQLDKPDLAESAALKSKQLQDGF